MLIFGLDDPCCPFQCLVYGTFVNGDSSTETTTCIFLHVGCPANVIVKIIHLDEGWFHFRPGDLELSGCIDGTPFLRGHHSDKVLDPYHLGVGNIADRIIVPPSGSGARYGRSKDPAVPHSGSFDVRHIGSLSEDLSRDVDAGHRFADHLVLIMRLWLGFACGIQRIA